MNAVGTGAKRWAKLAAGAAFVAMVAPAAGCDAILGVTDITAASDAGVDGTILADSGGAATDSMTSTTDDGAGDAATEAGSGAGADVGPGDAMAEAGGDASADVGPGDATANADVGLPDGDGQACDPNDIHNCGTCGHDCTNLPHVSGPVTCLPSGACSFPLSSCASGSTHCTANADLGCETDVSAQSNCGGCGNTCSGTTPVCGASGGAYACVSGCPTSMPTLCSGSCVDETSSATHCGTCTNACTTTAPHAQPACVASTCTVTCNSGYSLCTGACVDEQTDPSHCGACTTACAGSTPVCLDAGCVACTPATTRCSGAVPQTCDANGAWQSGAVTSGQCGAVCTPQNTQCSGTSAVQTCGTAGQWGSAVACMQPTPSCNSGSCLCPSGSTVTSGVCCPNGQSVCSGACTDTQTDNANCGGCAAACSGTCTAGQCVLPVASLTVNFHGLGTQAASIASSPAGITCSGATCTSSANFNVGTMVTLTVTQASGAIVAWSNGCSSTTCDVPLTANTTVNVTTTNQNIVFVTSQSHSGANFGGLTGANAYCDSAAAAAGVPGHFAALLATSTGSLFAPLGTARGWIRPDGLPFTDTVSGFQNNLVMWYPAVLDEHAAAIGRYSQYFTGNSSGGILPCADWTSTTGNTVTGVGSEGQYFTGINSATCAESHPLVCFGTDLTTPVSVTPVAGRHIFASIAGFTASAGIAAADALCQNEATAAGLANPTQFLAALATTSASAASRFNLTGATWVRVDGVQVAATPTAFMAGTLIAPPATDPTGKSVGGASAAWIGSSAGMNGPAASMVEDCNDWSSAATTAIGYIGVPIFGGPDAPTAFTSGATQPCNFALRLFCLEN